MPRNTCINNLNHHLHKVKSNIYLHLLSYHVFHLLCANKDTRTRYILLKCSSNYDGQQYPRNGSTPCTSHLLVSIYYIKLKISTHNKLASSRAAKATQTKPIMKLDITKSRQVYTHDWSSLLHGSSENFTYQAKWWWQERNRHHCRRRRVLVFRTTAAIFENMSLFSLRPLHNSNDDTI